MKTNDKITSLHYHIPAVSVIFALEEACENYKNNKNEKRDMNILFNKKPKSPFSLKSIENSNLFQRRVSNSNFLIDNHEFNRQMLLNYDSSLIQAVNVDGNSNLTPLLTTVPGSGKSADKPQTTTVTKYQVFAEDRRKRENMELSLGNTVTIEVNGFV